MKRYWGKCFIYTYQSRKVTLSRREEDEPQRPF